MNSFKPILHGSKAMGLFFLASCFSSTVNAQGCDLTSCTVNTTTDEAFSVTDCVAATVDGTGLSLREAISCTNLTSASSIVFDASVQGQTFTLANGEIEVSSDITILGNGETIDASSLSRVFAVTSASTVLSNVTITGGAAPVGEDGGCLLIDGGFHDLTAVNFNNCSAFSGGAIDINSGAVVGIEGGAFTNNTASRAGGAIEIGAAAAAALVLTDVSGNNNQANGLAGGPGNGGFLHITGGGGDVLVTDGSFSDNLAAAEGGAFWNADGLMTLSSAMISNNTAAGDAADDGGGGVFNNGGTLMITGGTFIDGNLATGLSGSGGGVFSLAGTVTLNSGSVIQNNSANRAGGGVEIVNGAFNTQAAFIRNNDVSGTAGAPNPGNGGGLHVTGVTTLEIFNSVVSNNIAANEGGGLWNQAGSTMNIKSSQVHNNMSLGAGGMADDGGGGVFNNGGVLTLEADPGPTSFAGNSAGGALGSGGAILSVGGSVSGQASFDLNTANRAGGAIEMSGGTLEIVGSSFTNNSTPVAGQTASPGNGGVLHITGNTVATVTDSSMVANFASREGGALWNSAAGSLTVDNSIIDGNTAMGNAADDGGGGIFNSGGTLVVTNASEITNNLATGTAGSGGGVFSLGGSVSIENNSMLSGNSANRAGGGIEIVAGILQVSDSTINNNDVNGTAGTPAPGNGGAVHISGPAKTTYTNSFINGNQAAREGGGLWNSATGGMVIAASEVNNNLAAGNASHDGGGGVFNDGGVLMITDGSIISGNLATGTSGSGGGILSVAGIVTVNGASSINANSANRAGGGIEVVNGVLSFINGSLTDNDVNGLAGAPAPGNGGGLHISGTATSTFSLAQVLNNQAANEGGGLWNQMGSTLTLADTQVVGNSSAGAGGAVDDGGGGLFNNGGKLNLLASGGTSNVIANNKAAGALGSGGGLLSLGGEVNIFGAQFNGNGAIRAGGAIEMNGGVLNMTDVILDGNVLPIAGETASPGNGGALHVTGNTVTTITGGAVTNNFAAREGGGLWNSAVGEMTVIGTLIESNTASGPAADDGGGGLFNDGGTLTIKDETIVRFNVADGVSGSGGGLLSVAGLVTISGNTMLANNSANRAGGAIEVIAGELNMHQSSMVNNDVNSIVAGAANPGNGGAVHVSGAAITSFNYSNITGNQAAAEGGGLWNSATGAMQVVQSLINNNSTFSTDLMVGHGGGGIFNNGGMLNTLNSTISGNNAGALGGGVLLVDTQAPVLLEFTTVTANTADTAGGLDVFNNAGVMPVIASTIIGDNTALNMSPDIEGELNSQGFNLIGDTTGAAFASQASDLLDTAPMLMALADNGGPTLSHMPDAGSSVIDNADEVNCPIVDQRNYIRPVGVGCDIGAIEVGSSVELDVIFKNGFEQNP